jgi:hypothetical protein
MTPSSVLSSLCQHRRDVRHCNAMEERRTDAVVVELEEEWSICLVEAKEVTTWVFRTCLTCRRARIRAGMVVILHQHAKIATVCIMSWLARSTTSSCVWFSPYYSFSCPRCVEAIRKEMGTLRRQFCVYLYVLLRVVVRSQEI